jgi:hypothetical protein
MPPKLSDEYKQFTALAETARAHHRMLVQAIPILQRRIRATATVIEHLSERINQMSPARFDAGAGEIHTHSSLAVELVANVRGGQAALPAATERGPRQANHFKPLARRKKLANGSKRASTLLSRG